MNAGQRPVKEVRYEPFGFETKRLPTERLLQRLGLKEFDVDAPFGGKISPAQVRIPVKMHVGAPCECIVKPGDPVQKGQLIAQPKGLGANIHASIAGTVHAVADGFIEIRR